MYDADKRHERYLRNRAREQQQARERYNAAPGAINERRRVEYHNNIEENRKKLRERQARRRANIRSQKNTE